MKTEKRCPTHDGGKGRVLPITKFHKDRNAIDGHQSRCKLCLNQMRRGRYARNGPSIKDLYSSLRNSAVRLGAPFELSLDDYSALIARPCVYGGGRRPAVSIGVDRKQPGGPYTKENVVPCCARHNLIKRDLFKFESMRRIVAEFEEARECGNQFRVAARKARSVSSSEPPK